MRPASLLAAPLLVALAAPGAGAQSRPDTTRPRVTKDAPAPGAQRPSAPAPGTAAGRPRETFAGFYRAVQVDAAATCTPEPLPSPAPNVPGDTSAYFPSRDLAADSGAFWVRVMQSGATMTLVPSDSLGRDAAPPITGLLQPDGSFTTSRSLAFGPEGGPRQGGRRFFVVQEANGQGKFEHTGDGVRWTASGVFTHRFHVDSATGAVFTTCARPFTASGTRVSP
jgi:hypothetical protein